MWLAMFLLGVAGFGLLYGLVTLLTYSDGGTP